MGGWGYAPSEFWAMSPQEFWLLADLKKPPVIDGMSDEKLDELVEMLENAESR